MIKDKNNQDIDTGKVVRFLTRESFKNKLLYAALLLLPISAITSGTIVPFTISNLFAKLAQGTIDDYFVQGITTLVVAATVGVVANRYAFIALLKSQAQTLERLQNDVFENLLAKDKSYFANRMTGKITSDVFSMQSAVIQFQDLICILTLPFIITMTAGILIVGFQAPILGLGLFVMCLAVIGSAIYYSKKRAPLRVARHELRRKFFGYLADAISNNSAVKIFAAEEAEQKMHNKLNSDFNTVRIRDWTIASKDGNNRIAAILLMQVIFIAATIMTVRDNPDLLATGIFAFGFTITLSNRLFEVSNIIKGLENSVTDASSAVDMFDDQPKVVDQPNARNLRAHKGEIVFDKVSFAYDDAAEGSSLFAGLNIKIKAGERVGLVGRSGGGKTTITSLLLRFNDVNDGQILIDGQDISKVKQRSLRENIAYVPQEPLLFHRSLFENIGYGKQSASKEQVIEASKLAHAHDFISELPNGYETLVGERGVKLSGGQRQRVAIARAMLKDAPILVLDEATSALDSESEVLIQDALWKLMEGRTAIVIAHRLSTIQKMDRIIVLDKGEVIEEGTHSQLIKNDGKYAELWNHQSGGFLED
jgi:ATP-binding cassette subfamily B protein